MQHIERHIGEKTFTYAYSPEPDHTQHGEGVTHPNVAQVCEHLTTIITELVEKLKPLGARSRISVIVTADHGHIDIDKANSVFLEPTDDIYKYLKTVFSVRRKEKRGEEKRGEESRKEKKSHLRQEPHTDPRIPFFTVREGMHQDFEIFFKEEYPQWHLVSIEEAENMKLFSDSEMSPVARKRAGDYFAFSRTKGIFSPQGDKMETAVGMHGGFLPEEMLVPLVIIPIPTK
eukprot:TRINITY_DN4489_c0_g1_i3.p1 TRINITY_DN4489_c0_g1~~TRINITY_DN4489_c0_g1_i3.p1  ORF type:complete len:231 (-),score=52.06 TRINITY_DN4489_c0_g1_i3:120-812(-)